MCCHRRQPVWNTMGLNKIQLYPCSKNKTSTYENCLNVQPMQTKKSENDNINANINKEINLVFWVDTK